MRLLVVALRVCSGDSRCQLSAAAIALAMTEASAASSSSPSASLRAWVNSARIRRRSSASTAAVVRGVGRLDRGASDMGNLCLQELECALLVFCGPEDAGVELGPAGAFELDKLSLDV